MRYLKSPDLMRFLCAGAVFCALPLWAQQEPQQPTPGQAGQPEMGRGGRGNELGRTDTPFLPGQKWRVHDINRPHPPVVTPADIPTMPPPPDAIVLFDGKDLSKWMQRAGRGRGPGGGRGFGQGAGGGAGQAVGVGAGMPGGVGAGMAATAAGAGRGFSVSAGGYTAPRVYPMVAGGSNPVGISGQGELTEPKWKVENGYFEIVPRTGTLITKDKFGDCQIHIEWSEPPDIEGSSQSRGNSGVQIMDRYEIQVLDPWNNPTYADGQAGALYGVSPPLVNPGRKPGEWNVYDIVFKAPRFDGSIVVSPAYFTLFFNGLLAYDHLAGLGTTVDGPVPQYTPHDAEEPLSLQDHGHRVRFRNIWVRRLTDAVDQPDK